VVGEGAIRGGDGSVRCQDVDSLLTPYVDGETPPADRQRVATHLGECRPCAVKARMEDAAHRVMQVRAASLATPAPAALAARCRALASRRPAARGAWAAAWRSVMLGTATALLVLTAVVGYAAASHSPSLLVAGLTLDHLKCFAFLEGRSGPPDPAALAARLERDYGWRIAVPASLSGERLDLVGARRCLSTDGTIAHVMYRHEGRPVSLFILPESARLRMTTSFAGYPARVWSTDDRTFILVASESDATLQPIARYFQAAAY
jgi:anti-sigma factor RsiW